MLTHIKYIYNRIVFISNSAISEKQKYKIAALCDTIIIRENKGFDFGAWKDALIKEKWDKLATYDNLTIMNDTCFGPICDLATVYAQMENQTTDFWGLTNCLELKNGGAGIDSYVPEHIQSYFMCFNKNVIKSSAFQIFWNNIKYETDIMTVIKKYEIKFTQILNNAGFTHAVFIDTALFPKIKHYITYSYPDLVIDNNIPLVKIKSLLAFQNPKYIIKLIQNKTNYPVSLIYDYFTNLYTPNTSLLIGEKLVCAQADISKISSTLKLAIHLHVFYLDVFEQYIAYFDSFLINFDLFITTDTLQKKNHIENYMQGHLTCKKLKEIIITENKGRDILPWLSISEILNFYDIVGHFHTKKAPSVEEWVGISWQQELFDLLLHPIVGIINTFLSNENIGIIIPDIPYYFHILAPLRFSNEIDMQAIMIDLWEKMHCKKQIDFTKLETAIMPCGTMFWYRPAALSPLFQLHLSADDVPNEPLPVSGTLLHSLERILIYIAWNEGFDYRIMVNDTPSISAFEDNMVLNKQYIQCNQSDIATFDTIELSSILNSRTYRYAQKLKSCIRFFFPKDSRRTRFAGKIFRFSKRVCKKLLRRK
jgi:rhamnosyltransferase